jgi:hypothetical protein
MSARLKELQGELAAVRRRLEGWADRLAALRARASAAEAPSGEAPPLVPPTPLFAGRGAATGALDDVELHFEVLDTEDPGREGR